MDDLSLDQIDVCYDAADATVDDGMRGVLRNPTLKRKRSVKTISHRINGPHCIVAIVASCAGRWHGPTHLYDPHADLASWCEEREGAFGIEQASGTQLSDHPQLHGFAVISTYRLLGENKSAAPCPTVSETDCQDRMQSILKSQRYSGTSTIGYSSSLFLGVARYDVPQPIDKEAVTWPEERFIAYILDIASNSPALHLERVRNRPYVKELSTDTFSFSTLQDYFAEHFDIQALLCRPTCLCLSPRLARLACKGLLPFDLYSFVSKEKRRKVLRLGFPSDASMVRHLHTLSGRSQTSTARVLEAVPHQFTRLGTLVAGTEGTKAFTPEHMMKALKMGKRLRQSRELKENIVDSIQFVFPDSADGLLHDLETSGFKAPSKQSMDRARSRLDCVSMVMRRSVNEIPTLRRQLMFDASPQKGIELFGVREYVVNGSNWAEARNRICPLVTLGVGKFKAHDKAMALLHSIALESGHTENALRRWVDGVRISLPDGGTEHHCNDAPDIIKAFLKGGLTDEELGELEGTFLFKYCLYTPELNHIFDSMSMWVIRGLSWFEDWFSGFRLTVAWLRDRSHIIAINIADEAVAPGDAQKMTAPTAPFKLRWERYTGLRATCWN